jgi:hypothetical protein
LTEPRPEGHQGLDGAAPSDEGVDSETNRRKTTINILSTILYLKQKQMSTRFSLISFGGENMQHDFRTFITFLKRFYRPF